MGSQISTFKYLESQRKITKLIVNVHDFIRIKPFHEGILISSPLPLKCTIDENTETLYIKSDRVGCCRIFTNDLPHGYEKVWFIKGIMNIKSVENLGTIHSHFIHNSLITK